MPAPISSTHASAPRTIPTRPRYPAGGGWHCPRCHAGRGAPPVPAGAARGPLRTALPAARPTGSITNMNCTTTTGQPTDTTAWARPADPADRPAPTRCTGDRRLNPHTTPATLPPSRSPGHTAVSAIEVNLCTPIDMGVALLEGRSKLDPQL